MCWLLRQTAGRMSFSLTSDELVEQHYQIYPLAKGQRTHRI